MVLEMYNIIATCYPRRKVLIDWTATLNTISYFNDKFERSQLFSGFEAKSKTVPGIKAMISETKVTLLLFYFDVMKILL